MANLGVSPNGISLASMAFGLGAGVALAATSHFDGLALRACALGAAVLIQLRLLCNMIDGLVAVECERKTATGDLWNEAPDRISDVCTLVGAGYAVGGLPVLGFAAALLAVLTAYIRALGASVGAGQIFAGPGAKPQRMAICTAGSLTVALLPGLSQVWTIVLG
ncbi:MAG: CDP-alcohol phosphatidyltransferase family protein, partial [Chthoniobacteraceae bacterium]